MFKNSFNKISCVISAIAVVVIAVMLAGCQEEDVIGKSTFQPIRLSEIPKGIVPLEFKNMQEAITFFNDLKKKREKESLFVKDQHFGEFNQLEMLSFSRLKSGSEQLGGSQSLDLPGWWFQSLTVYITYDSIGSSVGISSSMTGFTYSVGWEQTSYTYHWSGNNIEYTVYGDEIYYALINSSYFEVGRNPISASSTFRAY
jgi:hypothetical protein